MRQKAHPLINNGAGWPAPWQPQRVVVDRPIIHVEIARQRPPAQDPPIQVIVGLDVVVLWGGNLLSAKQC